MKIVEVGINDISPYENNPRNNDDAVEATANSIKEFGWQQPIVVDKDGVIIVGHTRLKAAKKLGLKEVPVTVADNLTDEQVKAYRLADNKTGELADWDEEMLDDELANIMDFDMTDFGFEDEISLLDTPTTEPDEFKNDFIAPPFSVVNTASGEMMKRKKWWNSLIKDDGSSRGDIKVLDTSNLGSTASDVSIMNPAVCELICRWFLPMNIEAKTFDCFSGDTAFGFVSSYLENQFTGIELRKEQVDFNQSQVKKHDLNAKYINDDGRNVLNHIEKDSQDLLFSCPPYYDLEQYSDLENDASNQDSYDDFLAILETAFKNAVDCLKDNRFACIVVGDIRDKYGFYCNFVDDIKRIFKNAGMGLYNEIILQDPLGTAPMRARKSMRGRKIVKIHQNLLVFYKGDVNAIKDSYGILKGFDGLEEQIDESTDL